uniref:rRNA adenine N(6)-methyltransferase n=1 Tax=Schizophyllum commune (strain H4-8 / FGSC 9210) TaxID=578458 RepID=D8QCK8_SCHCM
MLLHLSRRAAACVRQRALSRYLVGRAHPQFCAYSTKPATNETIYTPGAVTRDVLEGDIVKAKRTRRPRKKATEDSPDASEASTSTATARRSTRQRTAVRRKLQATTDEMETIPVKDEDWQSRVTLPPVEEWNEIFPSHYSVTTRLTLHNANTAREIAEAYIPEGSEGKTIIEAYPGPGALSRAILALPKERVKRLILVENYPPFLDYLLPLEKLDPRVTVVRASPNAWQTYDDLLKEHLPAEEYKVDWEAGVNERVSFVCSLPMGNAGEMFYQQWVRSIPDKQWLFALGRVPMHITMTEELWIRATASVLERTLRSKASVITEATVQAKQVIAHNLRPHHEHFFPARKVKGSLANANAYGTIATTIVPKKWQIIEEGKMDMWDFIVRNMFNRKASTVDKALPYLAPGAISLLPKVFPGPTLPPSQAIYPKVQVRGMQLRDWGILARAFDEWPFKPTLAWNGADLCGELGPKADFEANTLRTIRGFNDLSNPGGVDSQHQVRGSAAVRSSLSFSRRCFSRGLLAVLLRAMSGVQYYPLAPDDIASMKNIVMQTGVDCLFYGIQGALFIAACAMLARQDNRSRAVAVAIAGLFLSSLVGVVLNMMFYLVQIPTFGWGLDSIWDLLVRMNVAIASTYRFNYFVSDAIVVWRAWVLWPNSRLAKGALCVCLAGSLVGVIVECVWTVEDLVEGEPAIRTLMMTVPLLATNVVATALVGIQVWIYRRDIKGSFGPVTKTTRVEKVLLLLVESGLVYCLIWVIYLVINLTEGPNTLMAYGVISTAYHTIAGIYPTLIVLAVAMQRTSMHTTFGAQPTLSIFFAESGKGKAPTEDSMEFGSSSNGDTSSSQLVNTTSHPGDIAAIVANDEGFVPSTDIYDQGRESIVILSARMSAAQSLPLAPGDVSVVQFIIMQTGVDFLFYGIAISRSSGIQAALFIAAFSMLARQEDRSRIVTAAIIGLFVSSTIAVSLDVCFYVIQMPAFGEAPIDLVGLLTRMNVVISVAFRFNYIVSDAIVVWRAWVLWPDSRVAKAILIFCMTGSVALQSASSSRKSGL